MKADIQRQISIALSDLEKRPKVSVLIANFNYGDLIGQAIESVLAQSYSNAEIIICDDGSTDNSCKVIDRYLRVDDRIILIRKSNAGHASALNRAFLSSKGSIVCILDADDTFVPTKLSEVVDVFSKDKTMGLVIHDLAVIDRGGNKKSIMSYRWEGHLGPEITTLKMGLPMPQASGLSFRREVLEKILPLPADQFRSAADWAIAYTAAYITKTACIPKVLANYRIHGSNLSGTTSTAAKLETKMIASTLDGITRVITFVDQFMQENYGMRVPHAQVRNILEHRLMLGLLTQDMRRITGAAADLKSAYRHVREDYPFYRYFLWQFLASCPVAVSKALLALAFKCFKMGRLLNRPFNDLKKVKTFAVAAVKGR